jgi:hypothetical protein
LLQPSIDEEFNALYRVQLAPEHAFRVTPVEA